MIIGIDLDSTLNNLDEEWLESYNADYDDTLTLEDVTSWDICSVVKCGKKIYDYLTPYLFDTLLPQSDSQEVTETLTRDGHELVVISATLPGHFEVKELWLKRYFPHIKHFVATHSKQFIRADMLIDDGVHNLETFPGIAVAFDKAHNRNWLGHRVKSWLEVPELVHRSSYWYNVSLLL